MYADTALSTADQPAGLVPCYMWVRQLSLPAISHLGALGVETHFRDEWFRPLAASWMVHQRHAGTSTTGLRLEGGKRFRDILSHYFTHSLYKYLMDSLAKTHSNL